MDTMPLTKERYPSECRAEEDFLSFFSHIYTNLFILSIVLTMLVRHRSTFPKPGALMVTGTHLWGVGGAGGSGQRNKTWVMLEKHVNLDIVFDIVFC